MRHRQCRWSLNILWWTWELYCEVQGVVEVSVLALQVVLVVADVIAISEPPNV